MYAIIKTGGKQLKVEVGQAIYIEKLNVAEVIKMPTKQEGSRIEEIAKIKLRKKKSIVRRRS